MKRSREEQIAATMIARKQYWYSNGAVDCEDPTAWNAWKRRAHQIADERFAMNDSQARRVVRFVVDFGGDDVADLVFGDIDPDEMTSTQREAYERGCAMVQAFAAGWEMALGCEHRRTLQRGRAFDTENG